MGALACNLTGPPPPTVPPRLPTNTPPAPIGISTQAPLVLPTGVGASAPTDPGIDALLSQVDSSRLMTHVRTLYEVGSRYVNSAQNDPNHGIGAAREYIKRTFESYSAQAGGRVTVFEQPFQLNFGGVTTMQSNVVCILQGTGSGAGVIVVGAHYDSVAFDVEDQTVLAPGADDNATGVAAILEIARIMSQEPHRASIIFIAFSAEESGRQGSMHFVNDYLNRYNIDVHAVFNIDSVGNIHGGPGITNDHQIRLFSDDDNLSPSRELSRALHLIAGTYMPDLEIVVQPASDREGRWGDHMSFTSEGYAAVRMIEAVQDPARQNNSLDTIEMVTPSYLVRSTQVALATIAVMADGLLPPANISLRANGSEAASHTLVWSPTEGATGYVLALREPGAVTYGTVLNVQTNSLTWSEFNPDRFEAVAISTVDGQGRWGPFSAEYRFR